MVKVTLFLTENYIVIDIYSKAVVDERHGIFFHQCRIYFVNKLEFKYNKYQYNGTIREENYKAKFLFFVNYFMSFVTDNELILFVLNIFLSACLNVIQNAYFK